MQETSLILEHVETKKGEIIVLALCEGNGDAMLGSVASGYACEEIGTWFYQEALLLVQTNFLSGKKKRQIEKSAVRLFAKIQEELLRYQKKTNKRLGTSISMLLCDQKHYYFFKLGDGNLLKFEKKINYIETKKKRRVVIQVKRRCKQESFLLCSDGFLQKVKHENIRMALCSKENLDKEQITKILQEIANRTSLRGEKKTIVALFARSYLVR